MPSVGLSEVEVANHDISGHPVAILAQAILAQVASRFVEVLSFLLLPR